MTTRYGYDRELSTDTGVLFLEELALWGVFTIVAARPLSQCFKVLFMAIRFCMPFTYDPKSKDNRAAEHVVRQMIISAVADGNGGLLDSDWLFNWREALKKIGEIQKAGHDRRAVPGWVQTPEQSPAFGQMLLSFPQNRLRIIASGPSQCRCQCHATTP